MSTTARRAPLRHALLTLLLVLLSAGAAALGPAPASAAGTSRYVDRTVAGCSDAGPGTDTAPFCTVTKGVAGLQPGDTLFIGDGSYAETIKPTVSGTADAPVTVTRWPGRSPVIAGTTTYGALVSGRSYVVVSSLTFTGTTLDGIYVSGSSHVTVTGNVVTAAGQPRQGATAPGISLRSSTASTLSGNTSDHNSSHGFYVAGTSTGNTVEGNEAGWNAEGWRRNANGIDVIAPGNTIARNVVHDNEDSGLNFYTGGDDNLATLNVSYDNGDHGIDDFNVTGGRLIGNTIYRNCTSGINVEGTSGHYVVADNVSVDNAVYPAYQGIACARRAGNIGIWDSAPATTTVDHNLVWLSKPGTMYVFGSSYKTLAAMQAATGQEQAGVQADPRFADPAAWNLQLTPGSPALDRGDSGLAGAQDHDLLGAGRVRYPGADNSLAAGPRLYDDLGAYELQPSPPAPAAPTARLTATPTTGTTPLQVTADATTSTDPQGQTLTYTFDFGDGTTTGTQAAPTASHTYTTAGSYPLKVTVTDTSGLTDTTTSTVTASPPAPAAPTARLTTTPTTGTTPLQVTADATASTDPQGQTLTYTFDFGDGTTTGAQATPTASHTYNTAGSYPLKVTVTDTSGLTDTTTSTVTASPPAPAAPTARLTTTPTSGTTPLQVTADATASTDPQGQTLTYTFDFGDGTTTGPQAAPTASHTYTTAGSYPLKVTVTDTSGLTDTTTSTVTASPAASSPPTYVNAIANNFSTSPHTSGSITVWRPGGVAAGDLVVLTLQLSGTSATGPVTGTDAAGNTYRQAATVADGSGNRLVVLSGTATSRLAVNDKITVSFPTAATYRLGGDEFTGASVPDQASTATGTGSSFDSGAAAATVGTEIAFGAVAVPAGTAGPTWASGWRNVGTYSQGSQYLGRAYQLPVSGSRNASGTVGGAWLAAVVTLRP